VPGELNWIDIIIALFLIISLVQGIRAGLIRSVFTVAGIAAGFTVAIIYYTRASNLLLSYFNLPQLASDTVSFILLFLITAFLVNFLGSLISLITRFSLVRLADRIGGGGTGLLIGLAVVGVLLVLLTAFPIFSGFQEHVDQSALAPPIMEKTEALYRELSDLLPLEIPRLTVYPEELSNYFNTLEGLESSNAEHHDVNFVSLDGATCFVCEGAVEFLGFLNNDHGSYSPKFICNDCGRSSDGCQTYEGYHQMYGNCPVVLGNLGYRFDCGIWTNHSYHRPTGSCPVCGKD